MLTPLTRRRNDALPPRERNPRPGIYPFGGFIRLLQSIVRKGVILKAPLLDAGTRDESRASSWTLVQGGGDAQDDAFLHDQSQPVQPSIGAPARAIVPTDLYKSLMLCPSVFVLP